MIINIENILKQIHSGDDGQVSGKKIWGSAFFGISIIMGMVALFKYPDRFDTFAIFVAPFIGAGLTLWGFAGMMTIASKKLDIQATNPPIADNIVKVENVEQLTTSNTTKVDTANVDRVETMNSANTTVNS